MSNVQDNAAHTCSYGCDRPECIKAQRDELAAAAAQEAVAYRLEVQTDEVEPFTQYVTDLAFIATLRNAGCKVRVTPLYAAPVTAEPAVTDPVAAYERELAAGATHEHALHAICTPAAPGIDQAIAAVESIQQYMRDDFQALPPEVFSLPQKAQRALVTLRGLADAPMRVHPRDAKEAVDYVVAHMLADSPKGGSDPWRGLYAPERAPNRDEYGCFYHPDIPSWDDEREESIAPLLKAQGFDLQCVPGDFSGEAMEEGGERYWQEMREWSPEPEGDGWRLVAIYDTEDGPYSMFVKPLAQAGDAEVQP